MSQELKAKKTFVFSYAKDISELPSKKNVLEQIKNIPAIVVKGHLDHLIEMDIHSEEPKLKWKDEALGAIDEYSLTYLLTFIRKRHQYEQNRGTIDKPIVKHTYS